jgi:hypothetical protein
MTTTENIRAFGQCDGLVGVCSLDGAPSDQAIEAFLAAERLLPLDSLHSAPTGGWRTASRRTGPQARRAGLGRGSHLETVRATGLGGALSAGLARWRKPRAVHDPGKIVADLAVTLALGGDCLADIAMLRSQPELFGLPGESPRLKVSGN